MMRNLLAITSGCTVMSLFAVAVGLLGFYVHEIGETSQIQLKIPETPGTVTATRLRSAEDVDSIRRLCVPVAEAQDRMLAITASLAHRSEELFTRLCWGATLLGGILAGIFAGIHIGLRRLRAQNAIRLA